MSVKCERSQRHVSVIVALDHLSHIFDFSGSQACGDDSRAACLVIEIASSLAAAPSVVARCRETRDSKHRSERQDLPRPLDRSQENLLGVAFWKAFVVESDLRCPKQGDQ
ncbi:MAG: hypothetical protein CL908_06140 [Deltaproteobacteria bacterium]|nr:hypothetical protein [Deltaproteobacteria bacterium]